MKSDGLSCGFIDRLLGLSPCHPGSAQPVGMPWQIHHRSQITVHPVSRPVSSWTDPRKLRSKASDQANLQPAAVATETGAPRQAGRLPSRLGPSSVPISQSPHPRIKRVPMFFTRLQQLYYSFVQTSPQKGPRSTIVQVKNSDNGAKTRSSPKRLR
jgi:hypothetical protein